MNFGYVDDQQSAPFQSLLLIDAHLAHISSDNYTKSFVASDQ
jgi:hypothetical protein